jgi:hypothetical protein
MDAVLGRYDDDDLMSPLRICGESNSTTYDWFSSTVPSSNCNDMDDLPSFSLPRPQSSLGDSLSSEAVSDIAAVVPVFSKPTLEEPVKTCAPTETAKVVIPTQVINSAAPADVKPSVSTVKKVIKRQSTKRKRQKRTKLSTPRTGLAATMPTANLTAAPAAPALLPPMTMQAMPLVVEEETLEMKRQRRSATHCFARVVHRTHADGHPSVICVV